MTRLLRLLPVLAILCLIPASRSRAQEVFLRPNIQAKDIDAGLGIDWYGLYLKDKKIGYCKMETKRAGDTVVETFFMSMKVVSFEQKAELKFGEVKIYENKPPYRLIAAVSEDDDGASNTKIKAKRNDKGFEIVTISAGKKRTKQVAELDFTLADSIAPDVWVRSGPKLGAHILTRSFDVKEWTADQTKHKVMAIKTSLVNGIEVKFHEVESESRKEMLSYLSRYDSTGKTLSSHFAIFEIRRETEAQAKNTEFSQDLFVLGMVKIDKKIGDTTRLTELVVAVEAKEGDIIKNGPRQTVVVEKGKARIVKIGKAHANDVKVDAKEIEENLAETNAYVTSDAKVKALAKKAVGDAKTQEEKVKRIVGFAHDYIQPKLIASLPNIHDLIEKKNGDCKCYSLLVTNLCRAAGVPAREVAGVLYMGDDAKAFGGHAWNEVVLNGVWVPVDASLNQVEVDAGHVSFGELRVAGNAALNSLGKLSFKLIEVQSNK